MAKQNQKPKTKKQKNKRNQKNNKKQKKWQDPTLCHYSPPWGVSLVFFGVFLGFLASYFLIRCWFFLQWLTRPKNKISLLRVIPTMTFIRFNIGISSTTSIASAKCGDIFPSSTGTSAQAITKSLSKSIRKCSEGHIFVCSKIGPKKR